MEPSPTNRDASRHRPTGGPVSFPAADVAVSYTELLDQMRRLIIQRQRNQNRQNEDYKALKSKVDHQLGEVNQKFRS